MFSVTSQSCSKTILLFYFFFLTFLKKFSLLDFDSLTCTTRYIYPAFYLHRFIVLLRHFDTDGHKSWNFMFLRTPFIHRDTLHHAYVFFLSSLHEFDFQWLLYDWKVWRKEQQDLTSWLKYCTISLCKPKRLLHFSRKLRCIPTSVPNHKKSLFCDWWRGKWLPNCVQKALGIFPPIV